MRSTSGRTPRMRPGNKAGSGERRGWALVFLCFLLLFPGLAGGQTKQELKHSLSAVMSQEKYDYVSPLKPPPVSEKQKNFLKRIFAAVERFMERLGKALEKIFSLSGYAGIAVWTAFVLLPGFLIFLLIRRLVRSSVPVSPAANPLADSVALDHLRELRLAAELIEHGKFREAVSRLLTSLWLHYHHSNVVTFDAGLTNREYSEKIGDRPEQGTVRKIVASAEKAVYAEKNTDEQACRKLFEEVRSLVS